MSLIYNLIIGPIQLLFEFIFSFANKFIDNPGISIIFLSLAMNFMVLPLYKRADAMQEKQRQKELTLKPWVDHIKKTFKGDERFMMLQTLYRQNNYKPIEALSGSVSLLLQIPFFIAAYKMLSGLQLLEGVSFGAISDLSKADGLIAVGTLTINALPIIMTLINIISGMIYTKGMSKSSKIQLYGMALIFLVLLYKSPSGLVFYWTLNNIFSLCKNLFGKYKHTNVILSTISAIIGVVGLCYIFKPNAYLLHEQIFLFMFFAFLCVPIIKLVWDKLHKNQKEKLITKKDNITFIFNAVYLAILTGLLIPSSVVSSSPEEFIDVTLLNNPITYVLNSFALGIGMFVIWVGIFYMLANNKSKRIIILLTWILSIVSTVNYMAFSLDHGILSSRLRYPNMPFVYSEEQFLNLIVVVSLIFILLALWLIVPNFIKYVMSTLCVAITIMSIMNLVNIQKIAKDKLQNIETVNSSKISLPLSKNGKNVVVVMMDKAIGCYLPFILNENPQLKKDLQGFTYYPNTISYGPCTNIGSPALYGGYEYRPEEMDKRDTELLVDKHNEALKVMPVMFDKAGFNITVSDPTYANYSIIPDLSIFNEYPDINCFNMMGTVDADSLVDDTEHKEISKKSISNRLNRNLFCYSLFKITPTQYQLMLYANGSYNDPDLLFSSKNKLPMLSNAGGQIEISGTQARGYRYEFLRAYYPLSNLSNITDIKQSDKNSFIMMSNDTAHDPVMLQAPNYEIAWEVDNTDYYEKNKDLFTIGGKRLKVETYDQAIYYQSNYAAVVQVAKWAEFLRQNDVFDNTRIIIVADHGMTEPYYEGLPTLFEENIMGYNPLLLVKDFNTTNEEIEIDNQFMTNADTPTLATKDLIDEPINPFTNKPISNEAKHGRQHISIAHIPSVYKNNGYKFIPGRWLSVEDDIYNLDNWQEYVPTE